MGLKTLALNALEKIADWLDDRWTWTAIGLLTGYFGLGSADNPEWKAFVEAGIAVASLILILIRDSRRTPPATEAPPAPEPPHEAEPPTPPRARAEAGSSRPRPVSRGVLPSNPSPEPDPPPGFNDR